jgi:fibronectin type III domain protein
MTHPNLLRLARSCAKWRNGVLLVATLLAGGAFASPGNEGMAATPKPSPSAFLPGGVTDLRVSAVTDTSAVLTWTEVASGTSGIARYAVRYGPRGSFVWGASPDVTSGGCAAPVYGSTSAGGRQRSCVLLGLRPLQGYAFQIIAYTGSLATTSNFGPLSNVVEAHTAERVGPMLVWRPLMFNDSVTIRSAWISLYPDTLTLRGRFALRDYLVLGFGANDSLVARGYLLVVRP